MKQHKKLLQTTTKSYFNIKRTSNETTTKKGYFNIERTSNKIIQKNLLQTTTKRYFNIKIMKQPKKSIATTKKTYFNIETTSNATSGRVCCNNKKHHCKHSKIICCNIEKELFQQRRDLTSRPCQNLSHRRIH
jgi:hypothetical protein